MERTAFICATCGAQQEPTDTPPTLCAICADPRQYVPASGQRWTTAAALAASHRNSFRSMEPGLMGIGTEPHFAIGQRALLVLTAEGNVLWDCISLIDEATREIVTALGGISAIALSHPHFQASMVEWSQAFGDAPIFVHEADRDSIMRSDGNIRFWSGEQCDVLDGVRLINVGGHFEGACVLHWRGGADKRGTLFTADVVSVAMDARYVSFMRSFPNYLPLGRPAIERIVRMLDPVAFARIYGGWWHSVVAENAKEVIARSAVRYLDAIEGLYP